VEVDGQDWNPRFVAYARAHGRQPQAQLDHDRAAWPGGCMIGFLLWIDGKVSEWRTLHPSTWFGPRFMRLEGAADHAAFDTWLGVPPTEIIWEGI